MSMNRWWLVIRLYRGKRRVLSMWPLLSEAETAYSKEVEKMRDGDVLLVEAILQPAVKGASGGYNRTRW